MAKFWDSCTKPNDAGNKTCKAPNGKKVVVHAKAGAATKSRRARFVAKYKALRFTSAKRFKCSRNKKGRFTSGCSPTQAMKAALTKA